MGAKKGKILLVEDEAVVRESVRDWLVDDGYDVECAETGEEALERIQKEDFGVLVLDLRLPGVDGLQVFEAAKKLKPETKGIMITAYPSVETRDTARRLGLLDYLPKPFKVEDLEKTIKEALQEVVGKKSPEKQDWLELGAVSFQLCTHDYECSSCAFAQDIRDRYGTVPVISEDEITNLRQLPANKRQCPYREWLGTRSKK
jgi:DNA-binding NtrC family response regulator